ncbi:MAG: EAL domain-containing protein, partial [Rubrivivax sp.]|nr:EAL domain-containing protein [Rubrivivax sp.]
HYERIRAADAEIIHMAGLQRSFVQEIDRLAALLGRQGPVDPAHGQALAQVLDGSRADALLVEAVMTAQDALAPEEAQDRRQSVDNWQAARERLWYRAEALLRRVDQGAEPAAILAATVQVHAEVAPALLAATNLTSALQVEAAERGVGQKRLLFGGAGLMLLLLLWLAVAIVEPTVRAVQRQHDRLSVQTGELKRLALVAERTHSMVIITDREDRVLWANEAFTRVSGHALADAMGEPPGRLLHGDDGGSAARLALREATAQGTGVRCELLCRHRDGRDLWLDVDLQPLHDDNGRVDGFVRVNADITERKRMQSQLALSARTDSLTGLPNRSVVLDRVQRAIHHARRHPGYGFAVLFMDFDRFKQVNDTLGHSAGDDLLRQIAERLQSALRPGDALARVESDLELAARIGGDEFVIVLEGTRSAADSMLVAQRLLADLALPYQLGSHQVQSSVSIGVVTSDHAADSADAVLRDADTAMYEAKRAGRGRCVAFDNSMHERVLHLLGMEADLRNALRCNELHLVYQPVVDLASGRLTAVEALVRWRHPVRGNVPPSQFIPVAEETGLIDAIGDHVLQTACRQFAAWRIEMGERAPPRVAVNLSRAQLKLAGLVPEVKWLLEQNGMAPSELQLEVTESLAAQDEGVQATLRELKSLGVQLALDDFGTGYSSLACLHQLPVDMVKIDRSFVNHAETVEYHRVLIEATIRVARTLGMVTVAEGIETAGQAALMEQLACDRGQGYLFGHPMSAEDLRHWSWQGVGAEA